MDHDDVAVASEREELLIDGLMPAWDATVVRHEVVDAPPGDVWDALVDLDLAEVGAGAPVAQALMALRGLPEVVVRRVRGLPAAPPPERLPLVEPERIGWIMLGERTGRELVIGAIGRFWTPSIHWRDDVPADGFATFDEPGYAAIAWGFTLRPYGAGRTLLTTECRTHATDPAARRGFLRYWRLVGPFAAYIIGLSPRAVKRRAEADGVGVRPGGPASGRSR